MVIYISTPQELQAIKNNLIGSYELTNDIEMSGLNFIPIGDRINRFKGVFDGKGYKIKNLSINTITTDTGLFGFTEGANIKNIGLEKVNIISTANYSGGLVGQVIDTTISNCYVTGSIKGNYGVGGLVGWYTAITSSYINDCYTVVSIEGAGRTGGLIGHIPNPTCYIKNSFANSVVIATNSSWLYKNRALMGDKVATVSNDNFTNLFYNIDTNDNSDIGTGLTTSQFADKINFPSFDPNIWGFSDYPYLKVFGEPIIDIISEKETITIESHSECFESVLERSKRKLVVTVSCSGKIDSKVARGLTEHVESYVANIISNVTILQNLSIKTNEVESYVLNTDSSLNKSIRTVKTISSHLESINIITDIYVPIDELEPITAQLSIIENGSLTNFNTNNSHTSTLTNKTELQVK